MRVFGQKLVVISFSNSDFTLRVALQFKNEKKLTARVLQLGMEVRGSMRNMYKITNNMKKVNMK